ncbi:hypothetical protein SAMN03159463_03687 [Mesorhizobium sp. NFR06]|uniref:hypothetical protein n=1 Tax=Mesorhizobium sp. NFR06 TaxID=1566290 RepID=UPI0008F2417E|nr:hypothetical protein [Mesorhizobium sp. NFR06]SFP14816.1 hypothetical protein SAMN03159463_03687 [Mesorhizobium sp. NFR06]
MPDDDDIDLEEFKRAVASLRKGGGYRHSKRGFRDREEYDDAASALTALGLEYNSLTHRGRDDPPDCEAVVDGIRWGVEIVELADQQTLETRETTGQRPHRIWTREEFVGEVGRLISVKDSPSKLKGGPYSRYLLVVRTEELHLTKACLEEYLTGVAFSCSMITDACIALGYHPSGPDKESEPYPAVRITLRRLVGLSDAR